ncbi:hypothetical protein B0J17DRAFT_93070 [Rhizoctonia solani]|nr:hypothetical protein B0J17DRAFT_93070 [Rhizoctonia solani]
MVYSRLGVPILRNSRSHTGGLTRLRWASHPSSRSLIEITFPHSQRHYQTSHPETKFEESKGQKPYSHRGEGGDFLGAGASMTAIAAAEGAAAIALIGIAVGLFGGAAYVSWYEANELNKTKAAFAPGYNFTFEVTNDFNRVIGGYDVSGEGGSESGNNIEREEQKIVDSIIVGGEGGHYFLFIGPKGSGKTTMIINGIRKLKADSVVMCEAHPDLDVFRIRLGKALNYDYKEDSLATLFNRRDPRKGGPRLDIERAMNNLEKVAIMRANKTGRPIVLVFKDIHLFNDNGEGRLMLQQLQQKAEIWARSHIATMVLISDDFWPYTVMRQISKRMQTYTIQDLAPKDALNGFQRLRHDTLNSLGKEDDPNDLVKAAVQVTGGRLAHLNRLAHSDDLKRSIDDLRQEEKTWLLTNTGLIPDCDGKAIGEQEWSSCAWLLLREFVKRREAMEQEAAERKKTNPEGPDEFIPMPEISYYECRQIMARPDFIGQLDRLNIISIDTDHNVRLGSMLTLEAAREIISQEAFDELLEGVRGRIEEVESLYRTRELTFKNTEGADRISAMIGRGGSGLRKLK